MDKEIVEIIEKFKFSLKEMGIRAKKIIILGSHAKGIAKKHSDIDLVVISHDFKEMDLLKRLEVIGIALARAKIMEPVEALGYTEEEYTSEGEGTFIGDEVRAKGIEILK